MRDEHVAPRRGYPLISLFLVLTCCGVVAALVAPAVRAVANGAVGKDSAAAAAGFSAIAVMILGGIMGLFHYHQGRGLIWGTLTGAAIGVFAGPMILSPRGDAGTMLGLPIGGALVIVTLATAYRLAQRSSGGKESLPE